MLHLRHQGTLQAGREGKCAPPEASRHTTSRKRREICSTWGIKAHYKQEEKGNVLHLTHQGTLQAGREGNMLHLRHQGTLQAGREGKYAPPEATRHTTSRKRREMCSTWGIKAHYKQEEKGNMLHLRHQGTLQAGREGKCAPPEASRHTTSRKRRREVFS